MQGRPVCTATALGLLAFAAATASAAELPRKAVDKTGRAAWRKALHWSDECEEGFDYSEDLGGIEVMEVGTQRSVVQVVCTLGAYQGYQLYFLLDERKDPAVVRPLALRVYGEDEHGKVGFSTTPEVWGRTELDAAKQELRVTKVFRGIGDCGTWARYRFDEESALLVELRAKLDCDGEAVLPEQWPVVATH